MSNLTISRVEAGVPVWKLFQRFPLAVNSYLVDGGDRLILIDVGNNRPGEMLGAVRTVEAESGKRLGAIALTHGHGDHVGALAELAAETGVPVYAHAEEIPLITGAVTYGDLPGWWGYLMPRGPAAPPVPMGMIRPLAGGEALGPLRAFHTPGHTPGHLAFCHTGCGVWFTGDLLARLVPWLHGPPWNSTCDIPLVRRSARRLLEAGPVQTLCLGHGGPISRGAEAALRGYLRRVGVR